MESLHRSTKRCLELGVRQTGSFVGFKPGNSSSTYVCQCARTCPLYQLNSVFIVPHSLQAAVIKTPKTLCNCPVFSLFTADQTKGNIFIHCVSVCFLQLVSPS
ncbi:hypothetical protein CHARACLAT_026856 [Characodon lateralis]|uniref:Uncharacterized protein n=1 Tax=Characodon lateralis TaxID=208331 RepID=A0ABU7CVM9_9TELE|nr:hypothetical protein [Characodon lateralis]